MVICPVCKTQNDEYAIVCRDCKSYIQNRIANLDFFDTVWKVIESPRKAFHDITLAEHKNYSLLLFSLFGIALSFTGFWYFRLGSRFESLLDLLAGATGIGVIVGLLSAILFTALFEIVARLLGGKGSVRNSLGILAYATTPVSLSLALILPIELLTFGMYLFTRNPDPYTFKPALYVTLIGTDCVVGLWAFVLGTLGAAVSKQISVVRSIVSVVAAASLSIGALFLAAEYVLHYL
jgi:hypothetical protein